MKAAPASAFAGASGLASSSGQAPRVVAGPEAAGGLGPLESSPVAAPNAPPANNADAGDSEVKALKAEPPPWFVLPTERWCPEAHKILQLLHLDHVFQIRGHVHLSLWICFLVPLVFTISWIVELSQFDCLKRSFSTCSRPWTATAGPLAHFLGYMACPFQLLGVAFFLPAAWSAAVCLANYNQGHELKQKLRQRMLDIRTQCDEVLGRAQKQVDVLCEELAGQLHQTLNADIRDTQLTLDNAPEEIYDRLVIVLAKHLREVRQPAFQHLDKLIELSRTDNKSRGKALGDAVKEADNRQSMVQVLCPKLPPADVERLQRAVDPPDVHKEEQRSSSSRLTGCCNLCPLSLGSLHTESMHETVSLPGYPQLQSLIETLHPADDADKVLFPLILVMKWVTLFSAKKPDSAKLAKKQSQKQPLTKATKHFLYGLAGDVICVARSLFVVISVAVLLNTGQCDKSKVVCIGDLALGIGHSFVFLAYLFSLIDVLWHIGIIDDISAEREELNNLNAFKHTIDELNAHGLAKGEERNAMLKEVQDHLNRPAERLAEFVRSLVGRKGTMQDYETLATDLEKLLPKAASDSAPVGESRGIVVASRPTRPGYAPVNVQTADDAEHHSVFHWCGFHELCSRVSRASSRTVSRQSSKKSRPRSASPGAQERGILVHHDVGARPADGQNEHLPLRPMLAGQRSPGFPTFSAGNVPGPWSSNPSYAPCAPARRESPPRPVSRTASGKPSPMKSHLLVE